MKTKHIFVATLDVGELLPFVIKKTKNLDESFKEQERSKQELAKFIDTLQKNFKENIYYMGLDIIGEKSYERFIFKKGGFFEVMIETPLAMNAHFTSKPRATRFKKALQATLKKVIPKTPMANDFINSIEVNDETNSSLTVDKWNKMREIDSL